MFSRIGLALFGVIVCIASVRADTVYLRNGKTLDGEVIREDKEVVVIKVASGEITLKMADVVGVERLTALENRLEEGKKLLNADRYDRAIDKFTEAVKLDKSSSDARAALASALWQQAQGLMKSRLYGEAEA